MYNEHYPSILVTWETEHFSGKNGALRWSILVGKQKHNVQKPSFWGKRGKMEAIRHPKSTQATRCHSFVTSKPAVSQ